MASSTRQKGFLQCQVLKATKAEEQKQVISFIRLHIVCPKNILGKAKDYLFCFGPKPLF